MKSQSYGTGVGLVRFSFQKYIDFDTTDDFFYLDFLHVLQRVPFFDPLMRFSQAEKQSYSTGRLHIFAVEI